MQRQMQIEATKPFPFTKNKIKKRKGGMRALASASQNGQQI